MLLLPYRNARPFIDPAAFVAPGVTVVGNVRVERDASLWFGTVVRGDVNAITIGERTNIQDGCVVHVTEERPAVVGADVTVGHRAVIHGCTVHDGSLIGMGAVVLDGAVVGPNALVAAGALVREGFTVPPRTLAAGVPARVVRQLTDEEVAALLESAAHYVAYAREYSGLHPART